MRVSITVSRPPGETWAALTSPERLRQWLGAIEDRLAPGEAIRVDLGDGDFFLARVHDVEPERLVVFDWQFLGLGPVDLIRWELTSTPPGSVVTVVDQERSRDASARRALTEGWRDFLRRLRSHLDTGPSVRYDWRGEIDGAVDVAESADPLAGLDRVYRWLPVFSDGLRPRRFFMVDDEGPRRFPLVDWELAAGELTFGVNTAALR